MEGQNYLGIYLSRTEATAVCLASQGRRHNILGCFSVSVEETEPSKLQVLASLIAQGCAERELKFSEVAVALDCAMFMQHNIHSEFDDPKQIAATVRFDTEEAIAADVAEVAIAFQITSSDQTGSQLSVFTAQRKLLSEVILSLQSNKIDPATIEPDINCLSRFIRRSVPLTEKQHPFFCALSNCRAYFIVPPQPDSASPKQPTIRAFLLGPAQDRAELLAKQVPMTIALIEADEPINCLKVFDSTDSVNCQLLTEKLGIETDGLDLAASASTDPQKLADCTDPVDVTIAYGAALAHLEKAQNTNFRSDFMPYQAKKLRLQKTLKFLSVSVTILVLVLGLYLQLQLLQRNKPLKRLRSKFEEQYSVVMSGKKLPSKTDPVKKLAGEVRRIENVKKGLLGGAGEQSLSTKLTMILEAFNSCAAQTKLKITSISVTSKSIRIVGDTSSRKNTLKLMKAIKSKFVISSDLHDSKDGRDTFSITVVSKK